jgi:hypothetical protein
MTIVEFIRDQIEYEQSALAPETVSAKHALGTEVTVLLCVCRHDGGTWTHTLDGYVDANGVDMPKDSHVGREIERLKREHRLHHADPSKQRAFTDLELLEWTVALHERPHHCPTFWGSGEDVSIDRDSVVDPHECTTLQLIAYRWYQSISWQREWAPTLPSGASPTTEITPQARKESSLVAEARKKTDIFQDFEAHVGGYVPTPDYLIDSLMRDMERQKRKSS